MPTIKIKGFSQASLEGQLTALPEFSEHQKIPFELINENPLFSLSSLMKTADDLSIHLSQINLILRADFLLKGLGYLEQALKEVRKKGVRILLSSIGFESFSDPILKNLNKGVDKATNLAAARAMRELKQKFVSTLGYLREEGGNHGFIHPTPWDNDQISQDLQTTISIYGLARDILPQHSTPLVIHHASGLAHWIRIIEKREGLRFERTGTTVGWWQAGGLSLL